MGVVRCSGFLANKADPPEEESGFAAFRVFRGQFLFFLLFSAFSILPCTFRSLADYPQWWLSAGVVNTNAGVVTNDFAAVNAGQVKHIASNACEQFELYLPAGAGTGVWSLIESFSDTNNYLAVNAGQLKNVAARFYDRMIELGVTNEYPWASSTNSALDYAPANIGQVKNLFDFDPSQWSFNPHSISGTTSYGGGQTGLLWVIANTNATAWDLRYWVTASQPGAYSITNMLEDRWYYVKAYRDSNGNESKDAAEAWGQYVGNPIYLTNDLTGIDVALTDPDADEDELYDWVETGTGIFVSPTDTGTDPADSDSDYDGLEDGAEVANRTDPNSPDTVCPTIAISCPTNGQEQIWIP